MKIDLGQTLTILANLAVVAGIMFLIVQIREDRAYAIVENTVIVGQGLADWWAATDRRGIPHGAIIYFADYLGLEYSGANR